MRVILMMAITLDGKIAKYTDHPATWTSKADKKIFIEETKKAGVIIMGKTTYDTIGKPLPGRLNIALDLKPDTSKNIDGELEYTNKEPKELLEELKNRGYSTVILGGGSTINGLFLNQGLIDELWLTIEPKLFGTGLGLFKGADVNISLKHLKTRQLSKDVIQLRYEIS